MARETKAQREAREAQERAEHEALMTVTYPHRLMCMLERAQSLNFELTVEKGRFLLEDRDDQYGNVVVLTLVWDRDNQEGLHELEWRTEAKEERAREEQRRYDLRKAALAKLSAEELEVLGL